MLVLPDDFSPADLPLNLADGAAYVCRMRMLGREDAALLLAFFNSHKPETLRRRYGFSKRALSQEQIFQMVGVDQVQDLAYAIVEDRQEGERIVAVGRCTRSTDGKLGELAFVVHEARRNRGMASVLFGALLVGARMNGIEGLFAQVEESNSTMLGIFLRFGAWALSIKGTRMVEMRLNTATPQKGGAKQA